MFDEVPTPEAPNDEAPAEYFMVFSRTIEHVGGGSETHTAVSPVPQLDGTDVDAAVLALLPVFEVDGWEFEHIQVKTTDYTTYDPRVS